MGKEILKDIKKDLQKVLSTKELDILMQHYEDLLTMTEFYYKIKNVLKSNNLYTPEQADFETYRWILQQTDKPISKYMEIFNNIPKSAQKNIIKYMGHKSMGAFKKSISKHLNIYNQSVYRREEK